MSNVRVADDSHSSEAQSRSDSLADERNKLRDLFGCDTDANSFQDLHNQLFGYGLANDLAAEIDNDLVIIILRRGSRPSICSGARPKRRLIAGRSSIRRPTSTAI